MSEEHQLDNSDFGLSGLEKAAGYSPMPLAHSAPTSDDLPADPIFTEEQLAHARRPIESDWGQEIEREFRDVGSGKEMDPKFSVSAEDAAHSLALPREGERQAREDQAAQDLRSALDQTEQPQQPAQQDQQPQPESFEPQSEAERDAARAEVDAAWSDAEKAIEEALKQPLVREKLESEFNAVRAEAKQEVERAHNLSAAARDHYQQATTNLLNEAGGIIGALVPELNGLSGEQLKGALAIMQQTNPQRLQALQHLASRAQGLVEAQQRQQYEAAQGQALQREAALEQYTSANVQEYEKWSAKENPGTMKAVRENLKPTVEKYGVPFETLMAIHTGKMQMGATEFVRSAAFQKMLHDSIKYNLATRAVTEARSNPIPRVQRPGVTADSPRVHEGDLAAAASRFNLPGGNEGTQGLKNAAAWITARRGGR